MEENNAGTVIPDSSQETSTGASETGNETPKTDTGAQAQKTYSEADIEKAVKDALSGQEKAFNERLEAEKKEAVRLAGLDEKQRAEEKRKSELEAFEKEKAQLAKDRLIFSTKEKLSEKKLPTQFAQMLAGADEEAADKNIAAFESMFSQAVTAAVNERLKGTTPKTPPPKGQGGSMQEIIAASIRGGF